MLKNILLTLSTGALTLFLVTACAEEGKDTSESKVAKAPVSTEKTTDTAKPDNSIMSQPVDFSTPENVEVSLQNIRETAGDSAYNQVMNAMKYKLVYDLSLGNNKEKLYKKLDGKTPEQILAMVKR